MDVLAASAPGSCTYGLVSSTLAETLQGSVPDWLLPELPRLPTTRLFVPLSFTKTALASGDDDEADASVVVVGRSDVESVAVDAMAVSRRLLEFRAKPRADGEAEGGPGLRVRVVAKSSVVTLERRLPGADAITLGGANVAAATDDGRDIDREALVLPGDRFILPGGVRLTLFVMAGSSSSPPPPLGRDSAAGSPRRTNVGPTPSPKQMAVAAVQTDPIVVTPPLPAAPLSQRQPRRTAEVATNTRVAVFADAGVNTTDVSSGSVAVAGDGGASAVVVAAAVPADPRRSIKRERRAAASAHQQQRPPQPGRLTASPSSTFDDDDDGDRETGGDEAELLLPVAAAPGTRNANDQHRRSRTHEKKPQQPSSGVSPPPSSLSDGGGGGGYGTLPPPVGSIGAALDDLLGNIDGGEMHSAGEGGGNQTSTSNNNHNNNAMLPPDPSGSRPYLDPVSPSSREEPMGMRRALTKASVAARGATTPCSRRGSGGGARRGRASRLLLYDESPGGGGGETELLAAPPPPARVASAVQSSAAAAAAASAAESQAVYMGLNDMDIIGGGGEEQGRRQA